MKKKTKNKPLKKAKPAAKPVQKKAIKKGPEKKPVKNAVSSSTKKAPVPKREPVRKIIGKEASPIAIKKIETQAVVVTPTLPKIVEIPKSEPKIELKAEKPLSVLPKLPWDSLPQNIPARYRFLTSMAAKECQNASVWPFSFPKFLASLPRDLCGRDFSYHLMSQDYAVDDIAKMCKVSTDEVLSSLNRIRSEIEERFSAECNEIYRKWCGSTASIISLVEPYYIAKVDKSFQLTIGEAIIGCMRNGVEEGRTFQRMAAANL